MDCFKCRKKAIPDVEYAGNHYCENHFIQLMEKRIRRNLRTRRLIDVKKKYVLLDDGSSEMKLTEHFLKKIFEGRLQLKKEKNPKAKGNLIIPTNLDAQALFFLEGFTKDKKELKNKKSPYKNIMPLEVILQKEVELLCGILKIKFRKRVKTNILDDMEKKYPGTKFSVFQSKMNLD